MLLELRLLRRSDRELPQRGVDPDQLEKPLGYFAVFGVDSDLGKLQESLDSPFAMLRDGVSFKKFPCCYNTHRTADAAVTLSARMGPDLVRRIDSVTATLSPTVTNALIHHRPTTGLQGKFSAEYVIAGSLLDGKLNFCRRSWTPPCNAPTCRRSSARSSCANRRRRRWGRRNGSSRIPCSRQRPTARCFASASTFRVAMARI